MAVMLWLGLSGVPLLERRQRSFGVQIQTETLPTPGPKAAELDEMLAPPDQPAAPAVAGLIPMIRCSSAARMFTTARFSGSMSYLS